MIDAKDLYERKAEELRQLVARVKKWIGDDRTEQALEALLQYDESAGVEDSLIGLKQRWQKNEGDNRMGVLARADYLLERNKIVQALLKTANTLLTFSENPPPPAALNVREEASLEKLTGPHSKLMEMRWLQKAFEMSRSVARIVLSGGNAGYGTGFLVKDNYLFTSHHVLGSPEDAASAIVEFNYIEGQPVSRYRLDPASWIGANTGGLDFARVRIVENGQTPLSNWGYLEIDASGQIHPNDPLPIIQHPDGGEMKIALEANSVLRRENPYLYYKTDTLGGSSGSPVFNKDWKVVALHQAGMNGMAANRGILFGPILDYLSRANAAPAAPDSPPAPANPESHPPRPPAANSAKNIVWLYDEEAAKRAEDLRKFFYILERNGSIQSFDIHRDIGTRERDAAIRENLHRADLVMCLVTPMFLISCLPWAEEAVEQKIPVAPVLLEDTPLHGTVLERYFTLPTKHKNVAAWVTNGSNVSAAYMDIYTKIKEYLDNPKTR